MFITPILIIKDPVQFAKKLIEKIEKNVSDWKLEHKKIIGKVQKMIEITESNMFSQFQSLKRPRPVKKEICIPNEVRFEPVDCCPENDSVVEELMTTKEEKCIQNELVPDFINSIHTDKLIDNNSSDFKISPISTYLPQLKLSVITQKFTKKNVQCVFRELHEENISDTTIEIINALNNDFNSNLNEQKENRINNYKNCSSIPLSTSISDSSSNYESTSTRESTIYDSHSSSIYESTPLNEMTPINLTNSLVSPQCDFTPLDESTPIIESNSITISMLARTSNESLCNWLTDDGKHAMVDQIIDKFEEIRLDSYADRMSMEKVIDQANNAFLIHSNNNTNHTSYTNQEETLSLHSILLTPLIVNDTQDENNEENSSHDSTSPVINELGTETFVENEINDTESNEHEIHLNQRLLKDEFYWKFEFSLSNEFYDSHIFTFGNYQWRLTLAKNYSTNNYSLMLCLLSRINETDKIYLNVCFNLHTLYRPIYLKYCKSNLFYQLNTTRYKGCINFINNNEIENYIDNNSLTISVCLTAMINTMNGQLINYNIQSSIDKAYSESETFSVHSTDEYF